MRKLLTSKNKLLKIIAIFALLLFVVVYACEEELTDASMRKEQVQAIKQAKSWYEANKPAEIGLRASNDKEKVLMKPEWSTAFSNKNDKYEFVETDLATYGMFCFSLPECSEKYRETNDLRYLRSYTRIVFRTDKKTNETVCFLMTQVPSLEWIEKSNFKPFKKNCYKDRDKDFSGLILFHNPDGSFLNGWVYEKGKITGSIKYMDSGSLDLSLRSSDCTEYYYCITTWSCPYWYVSGEGIDQSVYCDFISRDCMYLYSDCPPDPDSNGDVNTGGGGGGSSSETTNQQNQYDEACINGSTGIAENNVMLADPIIKTDMNAFLKTKAQSSKNEWAVTVVPNANSYIVDVVDPALLGPNGGSYSLPPGCIADAHSHGVSIENNPATGSPGVPSEGDLFGFLKIVERQTQEEITQGIEPTYQTRYVYGTGFNGCMETYAINVYDRSLVSAFLSNFPASGNLNGDRYKPESILGKDYKDLTDMYNNGCYDNHGANYPYMIDAFIMAYMMNKYNMGVTLSRKVDNFPFETIDVKDKNDSSGIIEITTCQ